MTREEWRELMAPYVGSGEVEFHSQDPDYKTKKRWREKNREKDRSSKLAWYHRTTTKDYRVHKRLAQKLRRFPAAKEALQKQGGLCAICGKPETTVKKGAIQTLSLDHDHTTGRFRAWLCLRCNVALGVVEEQENPIEFLRKMQEYLVRNR